jgi:hypothetical protein
MSEKTCPAAPIVRVTGLGIDVTIRIDSEDDKEIARLAMEMSDRHSRPTTGATHDQA